MKLFEAFDDLAGKLYVPFTSFLVLPALSVYTCSPYYLPPCLTLLLSLLLPVWMKGGHMLAKE